MVNAVMGPASLPAHLPRSASSEVAARRVCETHACMHTTNVPCRLSSRFASNAAERGCRLRIPCTVSPLSTEGQPTLTTRTAGLASIRNFFQQDAHLSFKQVSRDHDSRAEQASA